MKKLFLFLFVVFLSGMSICAQNVTLKANNQSAALVFRRIMEQTGSNFVYSSDLLRDLKVSINVSNQPMKSVLDEIFKDTDISYKIKGKNVILKKEKKKRRPSPKQKTQTRVSLNDSVAIPTILNELVVISDLNRSNVEKQEIGFLELSAEDIKKTPTLLGENDIIRTLHTQAGVVEGTEGIAGMYVDGGNPDENLYILDNIPLFQANHFGGLFSPFNADIIDKAQFYKTGFPAKYDGRLSSFMDVRLQQPVGNGHHGSARLGLTSGAFNISGPIGGKTSYLFGIRRSWYDVLTIPVLAIVNSANKDQKTQLHYYFTDINAKIYHKFSSKLSGFVGAYYGNDLLNAGNKENYTYHDREWFDSSKINLNWGNLIVHAGLNYKINSSLCSNFTVAYNRYFSNVKSQSEEWEEINDKMRKNQSEIKNTNDINNIIAKADFQFIPNNNIRIEFGAGYTYHSFLPNRLSKKYIFNEQVTEIRNEMDAIGSNEGNFYFDFNWRINDQFRLETGLHGSIFNIRDKTNKGLSPRFSVVYRPSSNFSVKAAYSHTVQYIHQLSRSYLSLPTDQWIPITGDFKPENADKIAAGLYWKSDNDAYEISLEGYLKNMKNLIDYKDEYYLYPSLEMWSGQLTSGSGRAKGIDITFEKKAGKVTGKLSYSLAWSDRLFKDKNGGKRFPSRFDNRHTIKLLVNWDINDKVSLNAAWVGHSGNRFTLLPQSFATPDFDGHSVWIDWGVPLKNGLNNYQLPFYHRLDLSCAVRNKYGYWSFGLYNAYCNMNTVAIIRGDLNWEVSYDSPNSYGSKPVFKKFKLFPVIPSISYTWEF